jgi:polysaccharide biosynthesis transport protein
MTETPVNITKQHLATPRDVARVLFRHRRKIALTFCGIVALALVVIAVSPRSYISESKLFIRVGRESVALDPTATTGETIMLQKSQASDVNSALEILNSRTVLEHVMQRVGADRILNDASATSGGPIRDNTWFARLENATAQSRAWLQHALRTVRLSDPGTDEDLAIRRLENNIRVWAPKQSTVITISYLAASPELARDVVDAMTNVFLEQHLLLNQAAGSFEFFSKQATGLHEELVAAQTELRDRKNEFQLASSGSRQGILEEQIRNVELELLAAQRELAFSDAKTTDLTRAISNLKPELVTNRVAGIANEAKDGMREKLYDLELQESELKARYTDDHPLVVQIQQQREQAEEILTELPDDRTQTTAALNLNQRKLELELLQVKASAAALRARQKTAQDQRGKLYNELQQLNDQALQLSELERQADLLESKYRMHFEKLEQARVNEAIGRDGLSNVTVAQPATFVVRPTWPKKRLLLGLGLVAALGGALGVAFLAEMLDQTLRTTNQVEAELGLPVLLSFPYRKRRRRKHAARNVKVSAAAATGTHAETSAEHRGVNYRELLRGVKSNGVNGDLHAKTIGVVGCEASKIRSRVASKLAIQAAVEGTNPVLLIDADSRSRRVSRRFGLNGSPGWREVLSGAVEPQSCIHRPRFDNLAIMTPGGANGSRAVTQKTNGQVDRIDQIKSGYGLVVVDLPTARQLDMSPHQAGWLDEVILVVEAEKTRIQAAQRAKEILERKGVRLLGVVLANRREHIPRWLYQRL